VDAELVVVAELVKICCVLQVPTSAESCLPGPGDHEHECLVVVAEPLPGVVGSFMKPAPDVFNVLRPLLGLILGRHSHMVRVQPGSGGVISMVPGM
jgi:hypothetical protein